MKKNIIIKSKYTLLVPALIILLLPSCMSYKMRRKEKDKEINSRSTSIYLKPIVAELKIDTVKQQIVCSFDGKWSILEMQNGTSDSFANRFYCDYIVDPQYSFSEVYKGKKLKSVTVVLKGYPAFYKKFKQVDTLPPSIKDNNMWPKADPKLKVIPIRSKNKIKPIGLKDDKERMSIDISGLGIEFLFGNVAQLQFDYPVLNKKFRAYALYESVTDGGTNVSAQRNGRLYLSKPGYVTIENFSVGLNKRIYFNSNLSFRGAFGLNVKILSFPTIVGSGIDISHIDYYGLRFSSGFDLKLLDKFYLISKLTYNADIRPVASDRIKSADVKGTALLNWGLGLRYVI